MRGIERHSLFGGTSLLPPRPGVRTELLYSSLDHSLSNRPLIDTESLMENLRVLFFSCLYGSKKSSGRPSTSDGSLSSALCNPSRSDSLEEKRLREKEKEKTSEKLRGKDADSQTLKEIILNLVESDPASVLCTLYYHAKPQPYHVKLQSGWVKRYSYHGRFSQHLRTGS
jgi:hypothetical protein